MAYVKLNLGESIGRTIMPTGYDIDSFTTFAVSIYETTTPANTATVTGSPFSSVTDLKAATATVEQGKGYTVKIDASISGALAATGTNTFTAGSGTTPTTVSVDLKVITDGTGNGTFTWNLTYDGATNFTALGTATLQLVGGTTINISPIASGTKNDVPSGYYTLTVTLQQTDKVPVKFQDKVHIYQGMTSSFTKTFAALADVPPYTVTFYNANGDGDTETDGPVTYKHGDLLNLTGKYVTPNNTTNSTYTFEGWFTAPGGTGGSKVETTQKVFKNYDLYARWNDPGTPTPSPSAQVDEVEFTLPSDLGGEIALVGTATATKSSLENGTPLVITVSTSSVIGTVTATSLMVNGHTVTGNTLTIKYDGDPNIDEILVVGSFDITVVITVDGVVYTKVIKVTIT
jgi:hypothetical protein